MSPSSAAFATQSSYASSVHSAAGADVGGGADSLLSSDPTSARTWLRHNKHGKQLALLDKFLMEVRLGRLSTPLLSASSTQLPSLQSSDRLLVAVRTVELLRHLVGSTRWRSAAQLLGLLRGVGREIDDAGGYKEPVVGNVVRRVMAAVREEALRESLAVPVGDGDGKLGAPPTASSSAADSAPSPGGRLSLQSMLWALPQQHVRTKPPSATAQASYNQRQESFGSAADLELQQSEAASAAVAYYPPTYYASRPDLKQTIMEAIQEIVNDMDDIYRNINDQAALHIHSDEIILTCGKSKTIEQFLVAASKKRTFQVVVCESAPGYGGHAVARNLADAGIDTIVVHDSAVAAIMARVHKVLIPAHAVLANGGLVAYSGCNAVALAAQYHSVPVVCVTGLFKLCPQYPHEGQDTLNELLSPSSVVDYSELCHPKLREVELINPVHDYVKPENVSLYITNVGSFQPSFTYRLLAEYYHVDDWESF